MKAKQVAKMIGDLTGFDIEKAYRRNGIDAVIDYADKLLRPFWDFEKGCFETKDGWLYCCKIFGWLHHYLLLASAPTAFKDLQVYEKHFEDNFTGFLW